MQFFKELFKSIEISLVGGNFKFHIDFTTTSNLLDLFNNKEEEEAKKKTEEEKKREEEEEEKAWEDGKNPELWEDDDEW